MLKVLKRFLEWLHSFRRVVDAVERRDRSLAVQLRRAAASVGLNLGEGSGSEGGTRRQRYLSALGSAREVAVGLEVADALGYVHTPEELKKELSDIIGMLVNLTRS